MPEVAKGMRASVVVEGMPNRRLEGHVTDVAAIPTFHWRSDVRYFDGKVKLDNPPQGILPGMTAHVEIALNRRDHVLAVPVGSRHLRGWARDLLRRARRRSGAARGQARGRHSGLSGDQRGTARGRAGRAQTGAFRGGAGHQRGDAPGFRSDFHRADRRRDALAIGAGTAGHRFTLISFECRGGIASPADNSEAWHHCLQRKKPKERGGTRAAADRPRIPAAGLFRLDFLVTLTGSHECQTRQQLFRGRELTGTRRDQWRFCSRRPWAGA